MGGRIDRNTRTPQPRQQIRVGFSLAGSSALLDDGADKVYFDSDGYFLHQNTRTKVGPRYGKEHVLGLLLNLDESSPQKNTMSLFRDGSRASEPQQLPECFVG